MPTTPNPNPLIKPTHKSITAYYATLQSLAGQNVSHEMGLRRAFQELLADTAKLHDWTLVTEDAYQTAASSPGKGATVRPDATLRDKNTLPRGFWESKDTNDSLLKEIDKKSRKGYSLTNTIFEDSEKAILYQNGKQAFTAELTDPQELADLLNTFYAHTEPDIEHFEEAVNDFKDRVPDLANGLKDIIAAAHKKNPAFKQAFTDFFTLCQTALNPNIAQSAVDEMLVQHILTERLFRTIFNAADFTQRNVIAAEVEKVIKALASQSFSREEYLRGLDRFYLAIENAAKHLDWTDKQHFLNIVYERFFQGYSTKTADTMGIVYTPQPIVDFMCASVAEVLKTEFEKELGDPDVFILDPCTGTGNFIVNLLKRMPPKKLPHAYAHNLFANEIMLLPYYIAALNIEHAHFELTGSYEPFEGLCFVDTLDIAEHKQRGFDFFTQKNTDRVERQKKSPITVVIGNPPYNARQINENDNNKNREYDVIENRIKQTYVKDSEATNRNALSDAYVKFFRWASDRLGTSDGIVCFVSNNSFLDQFAFDGMRKHLLQDYTAIYHLDLKGNVRKNPKLSGTQYNVFGIQVGVGITILIRRQKKPWSMATGRLSEHAKTVHLTQIEEELRRSEKLAWVGSEQSIENVNWEEVTPDDRNMWLVPKNAGEFNSFAPMGTKAAKLTTGRPNNETLFNKYCIGVMTSRDEVVFDFSRDSLKARIRTFIENYNGEVARYEKLGNGQDIDLFVSYEKIKWSRDLKRDLARHRYAKFSSSSFRNALYRPFTRRAYYLDPILSQDIVRWPTFLPNAASESENQVIITSDIAFRANTFSCLITNSVADYHLCAASDAHQCFPFYIYDEDGSNRRENITDWALNQFRDHYQDQKISKWDIFHYVYALLHHPAYRAKFADNLKRELPRIPFAPPLPQIENRKSKIENSPASGFHAFARAGKKLADLHLHYESAKEFPLQEIITPNIPRSPRVDSKMKLSKDKSSIIVNDSLTLAGIPPETFNYRLGNRSALDWIIDQYQVYTDPRTQITSDPNAWGEEHSGGGNPEYILQLLAKIITVSLETQKIIASFPKKFSPS